MAVPLGGPTGIFQPAQNFADFGSLVSVIVKNAFVFAGIITFLLLIFGGFGVIVNAGDAKKLEGSQKTITGAVVGLLVIVTSYFILQLLATITGSDVLKAIFK